MRLTKIVSGGQTGVDRGALDAALSLGFPCGGWCPENRQSENGPIPESYPLVVLSGSGYRQRTLKNVQDSDATLIVYPNTLSDGTKLTRDFRQRTKKPVVSVDAAQVSLPDAVDALGRFVFTHRVAVLNVAGPRASGWAGGEAYARELVCGVIAHQGEEDSANR